MIPPLSGASENLPPGPKTQNVQTASNARWRRQFEEPDNNTIILRFGSPGMSPHLLNS